MVAHPVFQPEVYLEGDTRTGETPGAEEFFQAAGLWLDAAEFEIVSIEPVIWEITTAKAKICIETGMTLAGPWRRFDSRPLVNGTSFVLSRSQQAEHPLYRFVRWVVVVPAESTTSAWTAHFSATYAAA